MDLTDKFNKHPFELRLDKLPIRIFLDTNVIQYMDDFNAFIFDEESEECLLPKIPKGTFLYEQILSLKKMLKGLDRTPTHFAVSEFILEEIRAKHSKSLLNWFVDLYEYWNQVLRSNPVLLDDSDNSKLTRFNTDQSIKGGLSKSDFIVVSDAIRLQCDAILTCDRYRSRQMWMYEKYDIMILFPSDYLGIVKDFQGLWF